MRHHLLIAESMVRGREHINTMHTRWQMIVPIDETGMKQYLVRLPSGRTDWITIATNEEQVLGYRVNGRVIRECNSFATDPLFYYARRVNVGRMDEDDPQTLCWHWTTEESFQGIIPSENDLWIRIWNEMKRKKQ